MAAPRPFPVYPVKPHAQSGSARIKCAGRTHYLGKHGSKESYAEYERLRLEHAVAARIDLTLPDSAGATIDEMVAAWLAQEPRGQDHEEVRRITVACQVLSRLFGPTRANEFRANRLRAVQDAMVSRSWMTEEEKARRKPWSRKYINKNIERLIRVFKWAESNELLPLGITEHLKTVPDISTRDKRVEDTDPVEPADWKTQIEPTLKHLAPVVKALVLVQYHAGLRPDEACKIRRCDVDMHSYPDVWLYRPQSHKGKWRGHELVKVMGPECQRALAPWLMAAEPDGYVFPPTRRRGGAKYYTANGYRQAIRRGARAAGVKHWFPYQIRHAAGHLAEEANGLAGAAAFLGHHSLETTKTYTDKVRLKLAIETAKKIG